jgi:hypothetical protein
MTSACLSTTFFGQTRFGIACAFGAGPCQQRPTHRIPAGQVSAYQTLMLVMRTPLQTLFRRNT